MPGKGYLQEVVHLDLAAAFYSLQNFKVFLEKGVLVGSQSP